MRVRVRWNSTWYVYVFEYEQQVQYLEYIRVRGIINSHSFLRVLCSCCTIFYVCARKKVRVRVHVRVQVQGLIYVYSPVRLYSIIINQSLLVIIADVEV
jgi:hypothetical protein